MAREEARVRFRIRVRARARVRVTPNLVGARGGACQPAYDEADDEGVDQNVRDRAAVDEQQHTWAAVEEIALVVRHRVPDRGQRLEGKLGQGQG